MEGLFVSLCAPHRGVSAESLGPHRYYVVTRGHAVDAVDTAIVGAKTAHRHGGPSAPLLIIIDVLQAHRLIDYWPAVRVGDFAGNDTAAHECEIDVVNRFVARDDHRVSRRSKPRSTRHRVNGRNGHHYIAADRYIADPILAVGVRRRLHSGLTLHLSKPTRAQGNDHAGQAFPVYRDSPADHTAHLAGQ